MDCGRAGSLRRASEGGLARRLQRGRKLATKIGFDQRPLEWPEVVNGGSAAVGAAEQPALTFEFGGTGERQKELVGKPER